MPAPPAAISSGSTDGGRSWRPLGHLGVVQALAIGPGDPAVVYAAIAGAGTSTAGGLYKSIDGGRSWQRLTTIDVTVVALDPDHPGTVYVGTGEGAVYKSTDGGTTWQRESTGLETAGREAIGVIALVVDPTHLSTLYAATGPGVFRSTDAGKSWHSLTAGLPDLDVTTLALDATGRTLYAGTAGGGVVKLRRTRRGQAKRRCSATLRQLLSPFPDRGYAGRGCPHRLAAQVTALSRL